MQGTVAAMTASGIILDVIRVLIGGGGLGYRLLLRAQFIMHISGKGYAVTCDAKNENKDKNAMQHESGLNNRR